MVVFMDQLSHTTAPMRENVPILAKFFAVSMVITTRDLTKRRFVATLDVNLFIKKVSNSL